MTTTPLSSGLLDACDDSRLFGIGLWPKQREILAAVEQGPRLHVLAAGRRSSKTFMGALVALWDACLSPDLAQHVRRGERRYCVAVANNVAQARLFVSFARSIVERSPLLSQLVTSATDDMIEFSTGATVAAFPCTARGARGWPVSTLLLDEFAHHVDGDGNSAAEQVWRSLVPSTAQFGDDARIIVASTPFGSGGTFAELFERARAGELEGAVAHHYTSAELNPTLSSAFLSAELARDPELFRGEYEAAFLASGGAFIDANRLREAVDGSGDLGRLEILEPVVGCDLGFVSDPAAAVVVGRGPMDGRLRVARVRKWEPARAQTFEERRAVEDNVLADVCEIARYYGVPSTGTAARVVVDQHMSGPVESFFQRESVPVEVLALSAETKSLAFAELKSRIYDGSIVLPDNPDLLGELRNLRTQYRAGRSTVVTPRTSRGHSDVAVALALAVWVHAHSGGELHASFVPATPWDGEPGGLYEHYTTPERTLPGLRPLTPGSRL